MKLFISMAAVVAFSLTVFTAKADDAKVVYEKTCAKCHGADGKGDTKMGKKLAVRDLTSAKVQSEITDDGAFKVIKEGKKDDKGVILMKPVEGVDDAGVKALVAYVRTFKK